jgi:ABC-2 type transport system ATP-binding protein
MHVVRATELTSITNDERITLNRLDLTIEKGSVFGFVGPPQAGKTALLRMILGLQQPSDGQLLVFGERMAPNRADLRRRLGYVGSDPALPHHLTTVRFLEFTGELAGLTRRQAKRRLARLVETVGLHEQAHTSIASSTVGERMRIAIAAALMSDPELLLLDAPTTGLASEEAYRAIELIRELSGPDSTVILTGRRLDELERVCTDIGILNGGRLIYQGPTTELRGLARQASIVVEVDGHLAAFERALRQLDDGADAIHIERDGIEFAITCLGPRSQTDYLRSILDTAERTGVELLRVETVARDISQAYLDRLEADRRDGSLRTSAWAAREETQEPAEHDDRPLDGRGSAEAAPDRVPAEAAGDD